MLKLNKRREEKGAVHSTRKAKCANKVITKHLVNMEGYGVGCCPVQ